MTYRIPFLDLLASYRALKSEIDEAIFRVLERGSYILGTEVEAFEEEFAHYCQSTYCIGVASGLDALHLSLLALNIGPGDEVIVPSHTFIATWLAVSHCGAIPVPVEPIERTYNIDPDRIEAAINSKTKAIVPVHLYGQPADIDPIMSVAKKYGLTVVEDAAQSHGASYKGRRIGSHGNAVAWSFYPGKNLGAFGDGGAITTNDRDVADRIRKLRNYGSRVKYVNEVRGFNSRLDELHAAVLRVKLRHLDQTNTHRRLIARLYMDELVDESLTLPAVNIGADPVWHLFVVRHLNRDKLAEDLRLSGIETIIHYPIPPHKQQAFKYLGYKTETFPIATRLAKEVVSLPIGGTLTTEQAKLIATLCQNSIKS